MSQNKNIYVNNTSATNLKIKFDRNVKKNILKIK